jgi:hypothetical protein
MKLISHLYNVSSICKEQNIHVANTCHPKERLQSVSDFWVFKRLEKFVFHLLTSLGEL